MIGCQNTAALGQFSYLERLRNSDLNSLTPPLTQVIAPSMSKVAMQPNVIVQPVEPKGEEKWSGRPKRMISDQESNRWGYSTIPKKDDLICLVLTLITIN